MKSALVVIAAVLAASGQSVYSGSSDSGGTATWGANMSSDGVNVANYARTFSGGGHNVISTPQANGKRYVAVAGAGGVPCMFEFDEAAIANAVEGQVCAGCSRKLWCTVSASASYGGTQNETYHYGSVQFPRAASAPPYSFYAAHQATGQSPRLRRYLVVVKSTGMPPDVNGKPS